MDLNRTTKELTLSSRLLAGIQSAYFDRAHTRQSCTEKLAMARQMSTMLDREIAIATDAFTFHRSDWISYYVDAKHIVGSDCGRIVAKRAITVTGKLFWLCVSQSSRNCYHATHVDPFAAIEDAQQVWADRRAVLRNWAEIERFAADLIWGRSNAKVTCTDIAASPLCDLGVEGFLKTFGLNKRDSLNGRAAALLMKFEPQVGYALYETLKRQS